MSTTETYRDATFTRETRDALHALLWHPLLNDAVHADDPVLSDGVIAGFEILTRWDENDATETTFDA